MDCLKISIIMPVYNTAGELLSASVESVLNQSYKEFELIMVDDGSKTECASLCDRIAASDGRIKVIHQPNGGVSRARNNGTKAAVGNYVMYVDSDDVLGKNCLSEALDVIRKTEADFVFAAIQRIERISDFKGDAFGSGAVIQYGKEEIDIVRRAFLTQRHPDFLNVNGIGVVNRGPYARLLKAEIAKQVLFDEDLVIGEDVEWNMRVLNACANVCFVKSVWYGYVIYASSSLRKYYGNRMELLEKYQTALYRSNRDFCEKNIAAYAVNMAVSFYASVQFEYLSEACPLTEKEKEIQVKTVLNQEPFTLLKKKNIRRALPFRYRAFLICCDFGKGVALLRLWDRMKR